MAKQDIIVIGASAEGVDALSNLVKSLPADFPGSVFVTLHIPPYATSALPDILTAAGPLKAVHPKDGDKMKPGYIYVASPDRHLLMDHDQVLVKNGPKENRFRPSVDALFRSAAYIYGVRVVGVVLSGAMDDGTSGLWTIKQLGGVSIVQDPEEATFADMPLNAIEQSDVDYVKRTAEIGPLLATLVKEPLTRQPVLSEKDRKRLEIEIAIAAPDLAFHRGIMEMGEVVPYTCPDCHGALVRLREGRISRFRCHTGHSFTASALLSGISEAIEKTLWEGMRGLEENTMLLNELGAQFSQDGQPEVAELFNQKAKETEKRARVVHNAVLQHQNLSESIRREKA
ncbi:MAG: chemotaxis protein CheB [Opitutales bacterium]